MTVVLMLFVSKSSLLLRLSKSLAKDANLSSLMRLIQWQKRRNSHSGEVRQITITITIIAFWRSFLVFWGAQSLKSTRRIVVFALFAITSTRSFQPYRVVVPDSVFLLLKAAWSPIDSKKSPYRKSAAISSPLSSPLPPSPLSMSLTSSLCL